MMALTAQYGEPVVTDQGDNVYQVAIPVTILDGNGASVSQFTATGACNYLNPSCKDIVANQIGEAVNAGLAAAEQKISASAALTTDLIATLTGGE